MDAENNAHCMKCLQMELSRLSTAYIPLFSSFFCDGFQEKYNQLVFRVTWVIIPNKNIKRKESKWVIRIICEAHYVKLDRRW